MNAIIFGSLIEVFTIPLFGYLSDLVGRRALYFAGAIFTILFSRLIGIPTDGVPPMLFYLGGQLAWNYFANVLGTTGNSLAGNAGIFSKVTYIQRVNTVGGLAPVEAGLIDGETRQVPYTAEYYFYRAE